MLHSNGVFKKCFVLYCGGMPESFKKGLILINKYIFIPSKWKKHFC